jgi:hypothetical protein
MLPSLPYLVTDIGAAALFNLSLAWVASIASDALLSLEMPHVPALVQVATLGWLRMPVLGM